MHIIRFAPAIPSTIPKFLTITLSPTTIGYPSKTPNLARHLTFVLFKSTQVPKITSSLVVNVGNDFISSFIMMRFRGS